MRYLIVLAVLFLSAPYTTHASSPTSFVGSATVDEGVSSVEVRSGYSVDNSANSNHKRLRLRTHYDHAFNDWYAFRVIVEQDKRRSDSLEHKGITLENRFQLFEAKKDGWDGGVRVIYGHSDGDKTPHEIDMRLMASVPINEQWEYRYNMVWEHDIGPDSEDGLMLEFRNQLTRSVETDCEWIKSLRVGAEMFNDFGRLRELGGYDNQDQQIGPVAKGKLTNGLAFQAGYRAGISESAPDHLFKMALIRKF